MTKIVILLLLFLFNIRIDSVAQEKDKRFTIIVDAGHGGKDPGASGTHVYEKQLTLEITDKVAQMLRMGLPETSVIFTRTRQTEFVELLDRTAIANENEADLFVSIHCNASIYPKAKGAETYVLGFDPFNANFETAKRENSVILKENSYRQRYSNFDPEDPGSHIILANYNSAYTAQSTYLAQMLETFNGGRSRGVLQSGFIVLAHSAMPSILVETGYLTNPEDEKFLRSERGQTIMAKNIYLAIYKYMEQIGALTD